MDKLKRTYSLNTVKQLIRQGDIITPNIAVIQSANHIGFSIEEAYQVVLALERKDFFKSTTEWYNHKVWHDVYNKKVKEVPLYIKFKVTALSNKFLLQSFKKDERGNHV